MINDLRTFMEILRKKNELIEIEREVNPVYEATNIMKKLDDKDGPAVLFKKIKGSKIPAVGNLIGSLRRIALALDVKVEDVIDTLKTAKDNPIKPKIVSKSPVKSVVISEPKKIDILGTFPILTHSIEDAGPYITAGLWLAKDPETGRRNVAYIRTQVKGPTKFGIMINIWRDTMKFLQKAEKENQPLECSIALGVDPAIELAAAMPVSFDELHVAGGIRKKPIELVKGETIDVEAISNAEIVIEGKILPKIREDEGPFAEFTGNVSGVWKGPVFKVTGVLHRPNPIYRVLYGASSEHVVMGNVVAREPILHEHVKRMVPTTKAIHIAPYGAGFLALISIEKKNEGEAKNAIIAALSAHVNIKYVIVVDHDVDIFNPRDVFWAISTRSQGKEDFVFIPKALGHELDPSTLDDGTTTKAGIDATAPVGKLQSDYKRIRFEGLEKINLEDYF